MKIAIVIAVMQATTALASGTPPPALLRALPAGSILVPEDLSGDRLLIDSLAGHQTRRFMPAGAAMRPADVREPNLVSRNALVRLRFKRGVLAITAEGRALSNGALGESVRVMALRSKSTITGVVVADGEVDVR